MTQDEQQRITAERLLGWAKRLSEEHATPAMMISIGHDHKSGTVVISATEDVPVWQLRLMLKKCLKELK